MYVYTLYCNHPEHGEFPVGHFESASTARRAREEYLATNKQHTQTPIHGWIYAGSTFRTARELATPEGEG